MFFSSDLTDFLAGAGERQPKKKMIQTGNYSLQVAEMASGSREKKIYSGNYSLQVPKWRGKNIYIGYYSLQVADMAGKSAK
jgi:hypothetical protein